MEQYSWVNYVFRLQRKDGIEEMYASADVKGSCALQRFPYSLTYL